MPPLFAREITPEEICRKLRPVFGSRIDKLYLKYSIADRDGQAVIARALKVLYERYLNTTLLGRSILLEPPEAGSVQAIFTVGDVVYADHNSGTFGLREQDWVRHICISGMSGSGKTNLALVLLSQLVAKKKPFLVFDWKKSFRPLMQLDQELLCFTVGNDAVSNSFSVNITRPPPGVHPREWLAALCDLITEGFLASFGVHKMLFETLDRLFKEFGVYSGSDKYPTWHHVRERLLDRANELRGKSRESEWIESALRISHILTFGTFASVINSNDQINLRPEDFLDKHVLFELNSLGTAEKKFFCEYILLYLYKFLKGNQHEASGQFKSAILVDEAHNIFLKDRPRFMHETVTDLIYREIREYGIGLICLDQHVSKLSDTVAGNSATSIAFQQQLPQDVETVSRLMQLNERKQFFSMLPVGQAIVKLAERYTSPFLVKIPLIASRAGLTDENIKKRMSNKIKIEKKVKLVKQGWQPAVAAKALTATAMPETAVQAPPKPVAKVSDSETRIQKEPVFRNHLQKDAYALIGQLLNLGFPVSDIKERLLANGFRSTDVHAGLAQFRKDQNHELSSMNGAGTAGSEIDSQDPLIKAALKVLAWQPHPTAKFYQALKLSGRKGDALKKQLEGAGLIVVRTLITPKARQKVLCLSPAGEQLASQQTKSTPPKSTKNLKGAARSSSISRVRENMHALSPKRPRSRKSKSTVPTSRLSNNKPKVHHPK